MSANILNYKNKFLLLYINLLCETALHFVGINVAIQVRMSRSYRNA